MEIILDTNYELNVPMAFKLVVYSYSNKPIKSSILRLESTRNPQIQKYFIFFLNLLIEIFYN